MTYRAKNYTVTMFIVKNIDTASANRFLSDNWLRFGPRDEESFKQLVEQKIKWLGNKIVLSCEEEFSG